MFLKLNVSLKKLSEASYIALCAAGATNVARKEIMGAFLGVYDKNYE